MYIKYATFIPIVNGCDSVTKEFQCGVPQGSLLGPLLFILYINDFHNASNVLSYILFADDSNVFLSNRDPKLLLEQLNRELISVHDWVCANRLSLNLEKTRCMLFSNSIASLGGDVLLKNTTVKMVEEFKFLGLFIDNKLQCILETSDCVSK